MIDALSRNHASYSCSLIHAVFSGGVLPIPLRQHMWDRERSWLQVHRTTTMLSGEKEFTKMGSKKTSVGQPTPTESDDETARV